MNVNSAVIVLVAVFGLCHGQLTIQRSCPTNRIPVNNFDLNRYVGQWFELQRYTGQYAQEGDCVISNLTLIQQTNQITVTNFLKMLQGSIKIDVAGEARLSNPASNLGALRVLLPGRPEFDYWILATDYTGYSIVWSCLDVPGTGTSQVSAWVLSRTRNLDANQLTTVNNFIDQFFDRTLLRNTEQSEEICNGSAMFVPAVLLLLSSLILSVKL